MSHQQWGFHYQPASRDRLASTAGSIRKHSFSNNKIRELMNQYTWWFEQTYPQKSGADV